MVLRDWFLGSVGPLVIRKGLGKGWVPSGTDASTATASPAWKAGGPVRVPVGLLIRGVGLLYSSWQLEWACFRRVRVCIPSSMINITSFRTPRHRGRGGAQLTSCYLRPSEAVVVLKIS